MGSLRQSTYSCLTFIFNQDNKRLKKLENSSIVFAYGFCYNIHNGSAAEYFISEEMI